MKFLFKYPSKGRPDKFFKTLDSIVEMAKSDNYEIVATLDEDDSSMSNKMVVDRMKSYSKLRPVYGKSWSKISACNLDIKPCSDWDILVLVSDDMMFIKPGFDDIIRRDMLDKFPDGDGVLHYDDGTPNGSRIMTMNICGKKYFKRFMYIYHPDYVSLYADDENTIVAKQLNRYYYSQERIFDHNHWLFGKSIPDELNKKNDSLEYYVQDKLTFDKRMMYDFVNPFRILRPQSLIGEEWRPVVGYDGQYQVSNLGRVKSIGNGHRVADDEKILAQAFCLGYLVITLRREGRQLTPRVHRLVGAAFLPNPNNLREINHKYGHKWDNRVELLEWASSSHNQKESVRLGLRKRKPPEDNYQSKPVYQYDMNGVFLQKFPALREAYRQTGIYRSEILNVCKGLQKHAGGFIWKRNIDNICDF